MRRIFLFLLVIVLSVGVPVAAQEEYPDLVLKLNREFGYRGGRQIQGRFSLSVESFEDLAKVTFLMDGQVVGEDDQTPFVFAFSTGDYALGEHVLEVTALTGQGTVLRSVAGRFEFVSAQESTRVVARVTLPLLAGIALITILSSLVPQLFGRGVGGQRVGEYGVAGGAVCPKCGLPFSRHYLSPNLMVGKLERCPHCRRWSIVRRALRDELELAEAILLADNANGKLAPESEAARLKRQIEQSRFED